MLGRAKSVVITGIDGHIVEVEAHVAAGIPSFNVVGIPDLAVREAKERVRAALQVCGISLPAKRITLNLTPASLHKSGTSLDIALAVAITQAAGHTENLWSDILLVAEIRIDGTLQPVPGVLAVAAYAVRNGYKKLVVAPANISQAQVVAGLEVEAFGHLSEILYRLGADVVPHTVQVSEADYTQDKGPEKPAEKVGEIANYVGNETARYALEVAAAGGHHMLMVGPAGCGKTLLASCIPALLPKITQVQQLEVSAIHSLAGVYVPGNGLVSEPPFQAPHHFASPVAILGGGNTWARPGAVSLAHNGVLFLDELPEFSASALQGLRQPLETGKVSINRCKYQTVYPANFQIVAAANPCPCGNWNVAGRVCECSAIQRTRYLGKIGGPLMDRLDIRVYMRPPSFAALQIANFQTSYESNAEVRKRVQIAQSCALARIKDLGYSKNSQVPGVLLRGKPLALTKRATHDLYAAYDRGIISMRGLDRVLRIAWTVADLQTKQTPDADDVLQAMMIRNVYEK